MNFLDTSAVLEIFYNTEPGQEIAHYLKDSAVAISSITVHELLVGLKENERAFMDDFLKEVQIFNFDLNSAQESALIERKLKESGKLINIMDILISATCKQRKLTLVTCDKDFLKVDGLMVQVF